MSISDTALRYRDVLVRDAGESLARLRMCPFDSLRAHGDEDSHLSCPIWLGVWREGRFANRPSDLIRHPEAERPTLDSS